MPDIFARWSAVPYFDLVVASAILGLALLSAWVSGLLVRRYLTPAISARAPRFVLGFAPRAIMLARAATAALVIVAFMGLRGLDPAASLLLAAGLGLAVATLVYQAGRSLGLSNGPATGIAAAAFVIVGASRLGGLQPLASGLDRAGIGVGQNRVTLLDVISAAGLAVLLFLVARALIGFLSRLISDAGALDASQRVLFQKLTQIGVVTIAILLGIDVLGIDLTALAIFSGAFGLAIGFGFQKTFGNLISGLILLMDRSIKPGDVIAVGDTFGWVNKIGVRAVSVLTRDGKEHLIPNERLMTEEVENWSFSSRDVRVHVGFSVSYECDLRKVQSLAVEAAKSAPRVLEDPPPVCWIKAFGESAVEFDLRIWIDDPESGVGNIISDVFLRVWDSFKEQGVTMPFPQRELRIRSMPDGWNDRPSGK